MRLIVIIFFIILADIGHASYKILNFNTMCDLCKGSSLPHYKLRLKKIDEMIINHNPDLISFQEFRSESHIKWLLRKKNHYTAVYFKKGIFSYPDVVSVFNNERFTLLEREILWLGPNPNEFNLGWKTSLPRVLVKLKLKDKSNQKDFLFLNTHFDNRIENLTGSSQLLNTISKQSDLPIILAGDTNLTTEMNQFQNILKNYDSVIDLIGLKNQSSSTSTPYKNKCYLKKGRIFPNCIVEHLLLYPKKSWNVHYMMIDTTQTLKKNFPSDHRAFIYEVSLLP